MRDKQALKGRFNIFASKVALVIGTNIGTTATALLGSIGGVADKKRVGLLVMNLKPNDIFKGNKTINKIISHSNEYIEFDYKKSYHILRDIEISTTKYLNKISELPLNEEQTSTLNTLYTSVRESVYASKTLKDIKNNLNEFIQSDDKKVLYYHNLIRINWIHIVKNTLSFKQKQRSLDEMIKRHEQLVQENRNFINKLTRNFEKYGMDQKTVVSLLNSNRTILLASNSFLEAAKVLDIIFEIDNKKE